jgi:sialate O-acetylesterase
MNIQRTSILLAASLLCSFTAHAVVRPASHFLDNMVIQRDTAANVWGTGESVFVSGSWGQEASATADGKGDWMVQLQTPAAGGPYTLTFQGGNRVVLKNVLSGDVWICSGQSNMGFTVRGSLNSKEEMANANYPEIRNIIVPLSIGTHPKNEFNGRWDVCSPQSVANLSGVGYFFARELHTNTNVPIGLIKVAWGGTRIEPWTPPVGFELVPQLSEIASKVNATIPTMREGNTAYKAYLAELKKWLPQADAALANMAEVPQSPSEPSLLNNNREPTVLYNGMIHPLVPLSIKGAIWYQGEANGSEGISYFHKMQALIGGWREVFGQIFPFIMCSSPTSSSRIQTKLRGAMVGLKYAKLSLMPCRSRTLVWPRPLISVKLKIFTQRISRTLVSASLVGPWPRTTVRTSSTVVHSSSS